MKDSSEPAAASRDDNSAASAPIVFDEEMARLGRVLRTARGDKFSIEALAQRSGVSAGLLSQIERGIGNPSFQTLLRVANALGVSLADLMESRAYDSAADPLVVRRSARRIMTWPRERIIFEVLTPRGQRELNVLRSVLPPRSMFHGFYQPKYYRGTVCLLSQDDVISVQLVDGERLLYPGDTLTCRSDLVEAVGNPGPTAVGLLTVTAPGGL